MRAKNTQRMHTGKRMSEEQNSEIRVQHAATRFSSKKVVGLTGKWGNDFARAPRLTPNRRTSIELPHALRSASGTIAALLPFFLSPPCIDETCRQVRTKNSHRSGKSAPFRSESLRENQKTGERIHEKKIFKFTSLAISQNISTFACRLLSMWLICSHTRVLIAGFHWPKHGG